MNESETRAELIDPALQAAGWNVVEGSRIRREFIVAPGPLVGGGKRGKQLKADYILQYRNQNLAIIEAKADTKHYTEGLGQAKDYAQRMQVRFTYATNGKRIYQVDMEQGEEGDTNAYPSPQELWDMTFTEPENQEEKEEFDWWEKLHNVPYEDRAGFWQLRYYQDNAIRKVIEAVAEGKQRILLTLATGTGKTAIAFQIAWKLFHARWNLNRDGKRLPRILFLADRNILADQAFNAFGAFEEDALVRIRPDEIRKKGGIPTNGSIFFTIFQTFMSGPNDSPYFGEYPEDFFDFIIIDECHRGGANDESNWRAIMEYFSPAVQLGLTATPKRDVNVDTYKYFGEPVYTYSLKEGINDGFLTPFRVKEVKTTIDTYRYTTDDDVIEGQVEEDYEYKETDFNRIIEIKEREEYRVKLLMQMIDQSKKTLVFCATQDHALAIRDLLNQHAKSPNPNYCHRVTANDGNIGEQHLRDFQDNEKTIPTILTTSQKLSTGVDAPEVRNIVLLRPINSMVEFKQIIGRGTRLFDGKDYFTIYDYVNAHHHFNDPEWDGPPQEPPESQPKLPPKPCPVCGQRPCICEKEPPEYCNICGKAPCECDKGPGGITRIKLSPTKVLQLDNMVSTSFWSPDGKPMSAAEFLASLFGDIPELFKSEEELREIWSKPSTRKKLMEELEEKGYTREQMGELSKLIHAEKSDLYDVLAHVAYQNPVLERVDRANKAKIHLGSYDPKQQAFLNFVLDQYVQSGVTELDDEKLPTLLELKYNSIHDAKAELGDTKGIREMFIGFQKWLYEGAAG